jgi:hypothetical protein
LNTPHNGRPEFQRRRLDQCRIERYGVQIVVEKRATPTVSRVAGRPDSGRALAPMARAANVNTGWIGKKDVGPSALTLRSALQSSTSGRQGRQIRIIIDSHQHIGILRVLLIFRQ